MKNVQSKVGRRIRDIRVSQGIPQGQLADMAHMTKSYMSEIEAGKKNLTLRSTAKIADCLGVTLEELFPLRRHPGVCALTRWGIL